MRLATQLVLGGNAFRDRLDHPLSVKSMALFGAIVVGFIALGIAISVATNKRGEKNPQNLETFYEDDTLETKKLERTLSVALIAVAAVAISIGIYYVWEPTREAQMTTSFETRSVRRGQTLFANPDMEGYNNVQSLQCANCHGGYDEETGRYANGGTANFTLKALKDPDDPACADDQKFRNPDCITTTVAWKAPPLNTVLYKYPIRKAEADNPFVSSCSLQDQHDVPDCRSQVYDIITYGRPGTPMPAWGVPGGGPKNEQAIQDLVNFLTSIQLPADQAAEPIRSGEIIKQKKIISKAKADLKKERETAIEGGADPNEVNNEESVKAAQSALDSANAQLKVIESKTETQYIREQAIAEAQTAVDSAQKMVDSEAPEGLAKAQSDYDAAVKAYEAIPELNAFANPQDYLDKLEKDQTEIKVEKEVDDANLSGNKSAQKKADAKLARVQSLKNTAQNFIESRDALAQAKATSEIFAPSSLVNAKARLQQLQGESDGQLLFESNCARCHTKGWSYFTPNNSRIPLPSAQGTGALGPNLANVKNQFLTEEDQITFVGAGSAFQTAYGTRGIGSGRMPGFSSVAGRVLSDDQIKAIVEYERNDIHEGAAVLPNYNRADEEASAPNKKKSVSTGSTEGSSQ
jgi:mono/diheme cytochrome c family protein